MDRQRLPTRLEVMLAARNPGHKDQKTKEETDTKEQNTQPTKKTQKSINMTYNHHKPRCINTINTQGNVSPPKPSYPMTAISENANTAKAPEMTIKPILLR